MTLTVAVVLVFSRLTVLDVQQSKFVLDADLVVLKVRQFAVELVVLDLREMNAAQVLAQLNELLQPVFAVVLELLQREKLQRADVLRNLNKER